MTILKFTKRKQNPTKAGTINRDSKVFKNRRWGHRYCVECQRKIPKERIEALPEAVLCVNCANPAPRTAAEVEVDGATNEDLCKIVSHDGE